MSKTSHPSPDTVSKLVALTAEDGRRLFASERRRRTLDVLNRFTTPVSLDELASALAGTGSQSAADTKDTHERVAISLHHHHLPLMDDIGVIDYDPETHLIHLD